MTAAIREITTLRAFQAEVRRLRGILAKNLHDYEYPRTLNKQPLRFDVYKGVAFGGPTGDGTPFVELLNGQFHFVISERGQEFERTSGNAHDTLERIFLSLTAELAGNFELENRVNGQDTRRIRFARQIDLLEFLDPAWARREATRHEEILRTYPFRDE